MTFKVDSIRDVVGWLKTHGLYTMDHPRIARDPDIENGKPVIVGTRLPVEVILRRLAAGDSATKLMRMYPGLTRPDIRAAQAYAADYLAHVQPSTWNFRPKRPGPKPLIAQQSAVTWRRA